MEHDQRSHGEGLCTFQEAQVNKASHERLEGSAVGHEQTMGKEGEEVQEAQGRMRAHNLLPSHTPHPPHPCTHTREGPHIRRSVGQAWAVAGDFGCPILQMQPSLLGAGGQGK